MWAGLVLLVTNVPIRRLAQASVRLSCAWGGEVNPEPWEEREAMISVPGQGSGLAGGRSLIRAGLGQEVRLE